jgi:hypothetical protein
MGNRHLDPGPACVSVHAAWPLQPHSVALMKYPTLSQARNRIETVIEHLPTYGKPREITLISKPSGKRFTLNN